MVGDSSSVDVRSLHRRRTTGGKGTPGMACRLFEDRAKGLRSLVGEQIQPYIKNTSVFIDPNDPAGGRIGDDLMTW
jgi:hypothetical protein